MEKSLDMDRKLLDLSNPFTWHMEKVIVNQNKLFETKDDRFEMVKDIQDYFPEFELIYHLMLAYECVIRNDLTSAMQSINKAEQSFTEIKLRANLKNVERVLQHIFVATKCNTLQKLGQSGAEVSELLKGILDVKDMNKAELGMLSGCECLAWSLYYVTDDLKAINCAKRAIDLEPGNGKWYFLLGKNKRRLRRMHQSISQKPSIDETSNFEKAYELSPNALFGVTLAQSYRESRNQRMATKINKEIYARQPTSCRVQLQLALGFIRTNEPELAENCLKYVGERMPESVIYTHYMGIYEEKVHKNHKAALFYYQKTTERLNFGAEWQYMKCKKKVEPNWDPLPYMRNLVEKYEQEPDRMIQDIHIQIGFYYLSKTNDILSACQYLTKAIEIEPNAKQLQKYFPIFEPSGQVNIYQALEKRVQLALQNDAARYNDGEIAKLRDALKLCSTNFAK